ncbi:MAG: MgtC/SapB family protein [Oscillospiraceae bacterium]|jgi:putative Mg2+ transporter-C (MgtC) family protein|nr:MgtC/SapB family protein [Oscillospiraceae bacterium]
MSFAWIQDFYKLLLELNPLSISVRLLLSVVFSGVIGLERQGRHHPAGLRTHILVCVGACMTMLLGEYLFTVYDADPSRIGAQVISGIGFLGVGTIMSSGGHVRGITTAAGLWASACMGLAIGAGFYFGAFAGFIAIAFSLVVLRRLSVLHNRKHPRTKHISIGLKDMADLQYVVSLMKIWGASVSNVNISDPNNEDEGAEGIHAVIDVTLGISVDSSQFMLNLLQEERVLYAEIRSEQAKERGFSC